VIPTPRATLVLFETRVCGTAVGVVTTEELLLDVGMTVGMTVGRDAEEGRVGVGNDNDVDVLKVEFAGMLIINESRMNIVGPVDEMNITVTEAVWFGGRSTIATTPAEESKTVVTFLPSAEIVRFTEALENKEMVLM